MSTTFHIANPDGTVTSWTQDDNSEAETITDSESEFESKSKSKSNVTNHRTWKLFDTPIKIENCLNKPVYLNKNEIGHKHICGDTELYIREVGDKEGDEDEAKDGAKRVLEVIGCADFNMVISNESETEQFPNTIILEISGHSRNYCGLVEGRWSFNISKTATQILVKQNWDWKASAEEEEAERAERAKWAEEDAIAEAEKNKKG